MKLHKLLLPILATILLVTNVMAAATWVTPASGGVVFGTRAAVNITSGLANATNCSITFASTSTANTSEVKIITNQSAYNYAGEFVYFNGTFDSEGFEDANDYSIGGVCYNTTGINKFSGANASTITAITVIFDNFRPEVPTALTPADATVDQDGSVTFSATITDKNATGCYLSFSSEGPTPNIDTILDYSTTTCTGTKTLPMSNAGYYWTIAATDGRNNSLAGYQQLKVKTQGNLPQKALWLQQEGQLGGGNSTIVWIVIIGGVLYLFRDKIFKKK